jgi:DNA-binding CsgD family transcriptional regulator
MSESASLARSCECGPGDSHLTSREVEVLLLAAAGLRNGQIAQALGLSARTVEQHLAMMLRRARAWNRAEMIARCYAAGILQPDSWSPTWSHSVCLALSTGQVAASLKARRAAGRA